MQSQNLIQRSTQTTGSGVMISRGSFDKQYGESDLYPVNVGCFPHVQKWWSKQQLKSESPTEKNVQGKTTAILGSTPSKESIGKGRYKTGKNAQEIRQQAKASMTKLGWW